MAATSASRTEPTAKHVRSECCADPHCTCNRRNRYFLGKQLSPSSFQAEQRYAIERRRLLNRAIHGWGVVYGFQIEKSASGSLAIGPGFALDKPGRELLQVEERTVAASELLVLDENGKQSILQNIGVSECWLLSAHYAEQDIDAVKVNDPCQCEHVEWNYTCETIRFSLRRTDCAACCKGQACAWDCACGSTGWCDQLDDFRQRGGRKFLCEHATLPPGSECDKLCEIDEQCRSVRVDLRNGVPLACVKLEWNNCAWTVAQVDACGPRRLVKGNDILFDLIQGCDLTRIKQIGWKDWHRGEISFDTFSGALGSNRDQEGNYVTDAFWVEFSCPVREDTLRPDCFAMTIMALEREGGWWQTFRIPIVGVDTTFVPPRPDDPKEHVRSARIIVDGAWVEDGVRGRRNLFQDSDIRIEIEVRGDFIIDCHGQAVDANAVGHSANVTGNGTPGGTFLSTFKVAQVPQNQVPGPYHATRQR